MFDSNLLKWLSPDYIPKAQVEGQCTISRVCEHQGATLRASERFRIIQELASEALTLKARTDGNLPHL